MNAKHTPGPWNWHGPYMTGGYKVSALNESDAILMQVYINGEQAKHDCRLIAKAPELVECLRELSGFPVSQWLESNHPAKLAKARALLAAIDRGE